MRQPVYTIFISINQASFHLWWKENLVKHHDIPKYYENDWKLTGFTSKDIMMIFVDLADSWSNFRLIEIVNAKNKIILGRRHSSPLKKILHFYQPLCNLSLCNFKNIGAPQKSRGRRGGWLQLSYFYIVSKWFFLLRYVNWKTVKLGKLLTVSVYSQQCTCKCYMLHVVFFLFFFYCHPKKECFKIVPFSVYLYMADFHWRIMIFQHLFGIFVTPEF